MYNFYFTHLCSDFKLFTIYDFFRQIFDQKNFKTDNKKQFTDLSTEQCHGFMWVAEHTQKAMLLYLEQPTYPCVWYLDHQENQCN